MKCQKKNDCVPYMQKFAKKDYLCCGFNKKPKKYRRDVIKLCMHGVYIKEFSIEMTPCEALNIASCITTTLANIAQA